MREFRVGISTSQGGRGALGHFDSGLKSEAAIGDLTEAGPGQHRRRIWGNNETDHCGQAAGAVTPTGYPFRYM
jgi:hypothetical protein